MPEQTPKATIVAVHPPFLIATVDLEPSPVKVPKDAPKSNNVKVTVKGLGHKDVGDISQAFIEVRHQAKTNFRDQFVSQVVQVGDDSLVFIIKRIDADSGWGQRLRVQILLVAGTRDDGETKD
jgi:hypothetical protein